MKHKTWKSGWVVLSGVLLLSIVQMGFATPAAAVITTPYNWAGPHVELADPTGAGDTPSTLTTPYRDITKIYYAFDSGNSRQNFRMDINAATTNNPPYLTHWYYAFYIDAIAGSAPTANAYKNQVGSSLLPGQTGGIDYILRYDIYQNFVTQVTRTWELVQWNGTAWSVVTTGNLQTQIDGTSKILEWQINNTLAGLTGSNLYNIWGATYTPGLGSGNANIIDSTAQVVAPIPSAAWLLGSGVIGLIGLKRRMARKA